MTLLLLALLAVVLLGVSFPMADPLGSCLDRVVAVIVDPDDGTPLEITGGAFSVSLSPTAITQNVNSNASVTAAVSVAVLAANASRIGFDLFNYGDADLHVNFVAAVATTDDMVLQPSTGYSHPLPSGFIYRGAINAIAAAAPSAVPNLSVVEWV